MTRVVASLALAASALAAWGSPGVVEAAPSQEADDGPTTRYIVVLEPEVASAEVAAVLDIAEYGIEVHGIYSHAVKGYTADMTELQYAELSADADVAYIEADRLLHISSQVVPTGVQRVFADENANLDIDGRDDQRIDVDVAVIDTGVSPQADLDVKSRVDCTSATCLANVGSDDNGHGSHVAGTIGAIDNSIGVVGVAPGARIHGLKVCNASGECPNSAILAAVDWVTARSAVIEVANMSLGGAGVNNPLNASIARSVDSGVVYVVAAGNEGRDAAGYSPASSPDVITVSAIADSDGRAGGVGGAPACRPHASDDRLADFSNHGSVVDIAAPGVCVLSTWNDGSLQLMSGTSMASPHVAGAAAVLASGPRDPESRADVDAIRLRLLGAASAAWVDSSNDGVKEPLLDVHDENRFPPPLPGPVKVFSDGLEGTTGRWVVNPYLTDTATAGRWKRADPAGTSYDNRPYQLSNAANGTFDLVTGPAAGAGVGSGDIDGGVTSIRSRLITLPSSGALSLRFHYYLAHLRNATSDDYLRISIVDGQTRSKVFEVRGSVTDRPAVWAWVTVDLKPYAGRQISVLVEAADEGVASLVEAAVDDVVIVQG